MPFDRGSAGVTGGAIGLDRRALLKSAAISAALAAPALAGAEARQAEAAPRATPSDSAAREETMSNGEFAPSRLVRMREALSAHVESGRVPGLVALASRRGETHVETLGAMSLGGAPMRRDAIFRVASITKPIVAAAAMMLVEECRLRLDDPVDPWLPELAERRVLRRIDAPLDVS